MEREIKRYRPPTVQDKETEKFYKSPNCIHDPLITNKCNLVETTTQDCYECLKGSVVNGIRKVVGMDPENVLGIERYILFVEKYCELPKKKLKCILLKPKWRQKNDCHKTNST